MVSGKCITSQAPGTALLFGFALIENLIGKEKAEEIKKGIVF